MEHVYYYIGLIIFWIGGIAMFLLLTIQILDKCFQYIKIFVEFRNRFMEYYINRNEFNEWKKNKE